MLRYIDEEMCVGVPSQEEFENELGENGMSRLERAVI